VICKISTADLGLQYSGIFRWLCIIYGVSTSGWLMMALWQVHLWIFSIDTIVTSHVSLLYFFTGSDLKKMALHYNVSLSTIHVLLGPGLTALPALGQRWGRIMNNQDSTPTNKM
jgi:hypothetical protein